MENIEDIVKHYNISYSEYYPAMETVLYFDADDTQLDIPDEEQEILESGTLDAVKQWEEMQNTGKLTVEEYEQCVETQYNIST